MLALAGRSGAAGSPRGRRPAAASRPNILVIMTDDQTVDQMRALPKTRALLAARGTTFANSFVDFSLCCPSRSTFLTGQYAHNHGVLANGGPHGGYRPSRPFEHPAALAPGGRLLHGPRRQIPQQLSARTPPRRRRGGRAGSALIDPSTYRMYDYTVSDNGKPVAYTESPRDYQTDVIAAKAEEILRSRAGSGQPFFVTVAPPRAAPGAARPASRRRRAPAPRYAGRFAAEPLPRKPSFNEADVRGQAGPHPPPAAAQPGEERARSARPTAACLASLLAVDDLVERLVRTLDETGQLDRTVIVFTSDNGFFFGEHRVTEGKYLPYEESIRVPLIIRGGAASRPGPRSAQPVSNVDLAPTIVALAGARARRVMDGRPLLPLALDPEQGKGRTLLIEGYGEGKDKPPFAAVRDPRWFYAEYRNGDRELYDLQTDPAELRSLHADPASAAVRQDLARRLARLRACSGSSCR